MSKRHAVKVSPEQLTPGDLAMFKAAQQHVLQAQQQQMAAIGALQFVTHVLAERYGLVEGGSFNTETGDILRPPGPEA